MSKVTDGLYVGDLYKAHRLFDNPDFLPENDGYGLNSSLGTIDKIKGVISVCYDLPRWCCESSGHFKKDGPYETDCSRRLSSFPSFDRGYIDLHVDRINHKSVDSQEDTTSNDESDTYVLHAVIRADDGNSECLFRAFGFTYDFIETVKNNEQGCTYIHCMMGMSRSCSLVCSYLMKKKQITYTEAIRQLKILHPIASPNLAFLCQLILYRKNGYKAHKNHRFWDASNKLYRVIDPNDLASYETITEDNNHDSEENAVFSCMKCRQTLFYGNNILKHTPDTKETADTKPCSSVFVEPMDWMSDVDTQSGKISCKNERCASKLGYYCWYGRRCSCGHLQVPAFQIQLSKVDKLFTESRLSGATPVRNESLLL